MPGDRIECLHRGGTRSFMEDRVWLHHKGFLRQWSHRHKESNLSKRHKNKKESRIHKTSKPSNHRLHRSSFLPFNLEVQTSSDLILPIPYFYLLPNYQIYQVSSGFCVPTSSNMDVRQTSGRSASCSSESHAQSGLGCGG